MVYKFGQLFEIIDGDRGKNYPGDSDFFDEGYCLFLNAGNVTKSGWSFESNAFIAKEKDEQLRKGRVNRGDTVFTTRGTVGNAAYYGDKVPFENIRINSGMVILRPKDEAIVDNEFIYYLVTSPLAKKTIELYCSGSAQPQLPIKDFVKIKYDLPSIAKQRQIVSVLNSFDNLIEVNNKRIKVLEQMAENLYKEWFVRFRFPGHESIPFENGLPQGWKQDTASSVFNITIGKTPPRKEFEWFTENDPNAVNWVSVSDMKNAYVFTTDEQLTRTAIDRFNMIVVPKNTVLLSFKLTVGRVSIAQTPCATNEAIAHFGGMSETYREFLYYQLKNYDYSKLGNTSSIGNAVNSKVIKNMKLLYPEEIVLRRFHETSKPLVDEIISICSQNQILICQRDLLLPRLMSGKLEV